jgi:hypothetical protein
MKKWISGLIAEQRKGKQPWYVNAMWVCILISFFALGTLAIRAPKVERDHLHYTQFLLMVVALCITLLVNKIRTGLFLPGKKRNQ